MIWRCRSLAQICRIDIALLGHVVVRIERVVLLPVLWHLILVHEILIVLTNVVGVLNVAQLIVLKRSLIVRRVLILEGIVEMR